MIPTRKHLGAMLLGLAVILGLVATTIAPRPVLAQADLGSVSGTVIDASGAVVANATVKVTNTATGAERSTVTGSNGDYSVTQLTPATYIVAISGTGFETASQKVNVTVGSSNSVNVRLAVAGGKTEIVVSADDFAGVQLDKAEISSVIETEQIQSLPTLDRNPYNLVQFSGNLSSDPTATSRGVGFNISGARSASVDILLDGTENTDLYAVAIGQTVPMDATSEIRIVTSNSGAEYGRGAGAVNVSTKSGSNQVHGSVYEFNRISTLASDGFNNNYLHDMYGTLAKPRYTHNQFGYSVGGPVKTDKLFFFSSTEWTRIRSAQNEVSIVPTPDLISMSAANMQSFFSTYGKLTKPVNGQSYTGASTALTSVYGADVLSIAQSQMQVTPDPNNPVTACSDSRISAAPICTKNIFGQSIYEVPADSGGGTPVNQWISFNRGDWTISPTTQMFVRYIQQSSVYPAGTNNYSPYDGYDTGYTVFNHNLELSLTRAFTPQLASATKVLAARFNQSQPLGKVPVSPTLYPNSGGAVSLGGGYITYPGYLATSPGNAIPFGGPQNFIQLGEDLAWSKGRHQFTFGGNFLYIKDNRVFGAYENAIDALVQSGNDGALINFIGGGLGYLNVAINPKGVYPCSRDSSGQYQINPNCEIQLPATSPNFSRSNRYHDGDAYVNDSWKLTPKFTANLGLRWEVYGPQHSQNPAYDSNFFFGAGDTIWDRVRNGGLKTRETSPNGRLWNLNLKQFGPKIGFAWDPIGNGKNSIRGGFGISYERNFNNVTFNVIQNPPNYAVVSFTKADNNGALIPVDTNNFSTFGTGTGLKYLPNVTLRAVDPNIKPAYTENWSLSVEHQMDSTTVSASYVGSRGIHNYSIANINRTFDGSTYLGDARVANRTNYQFGNINFRGADGDSYYEGLTTEIRSANLLRTGLNVRGDYTYSHSIDNDSSTFNDSANEAGGGLVLGYLDPFNHALDRGNSDFDQKHRVAAALVWTLPFASHMTGASKSLLDNWTLSATFDAQTGTPFTEYDCYACYNVYPRASFVNKPSRNRTANETDISSIYGANTFSYMKLPDFYDNQGNVNTANYREQINPSTGTSDTPVCSSIHGGGCQFVSGMDGRNLFRAPGSWHQNLGVVKDIKIHERYDIQLKGEFINLLNHANTYLNLGSASDVSSFTDVLAYKSGNRNTELSLHFAF
jgi:hypothetical protein